ncbi:MAG: UxaA family hydrolase [Sporomusa sp.]
MSAMRAIIMKPNDTVGTVVEAITANMNVIAECSGTKLTIQVADNIPAGHKFALRKIQKGEAVIKYGEIIGLATKDIQPRQHVHVDNIESCRGRGDK